MDKRTKAATFLLLAVFTLVVSSAAQERVRDEQGEFEYLAAPGGVLIAAPHGTYDVNTAPLAIAVAGRLGAGYVVFRGSTGAGAWINVNRPTEGAGRSCPNEPHTDRARATYETYVRLVRAAAGVTASGSTWRSTGTPTRARRRTSRSPRRAFRPPKRW